VARVGELHAASRSVTEEPHSGVRHVHVDSTCMGRNAPKPSISSISFFSSGSGASVLKYRS
jgi:hypothetical protein